MTEAEDILAFWFPQGLDADQAMHGRQFQFWFGGGANGQIAQRFAAAHETATLGAPDAWADTPRGRLALIIVLDQFSRSLHVGTAAAYAQDERAIGLTIDGLERGFYDKLTTVWEKTFFMLPLGHSERLADFDRCIALADALIPEAPVQVRALYEFSASQARGHRAVVALWAAAASQRRPGPELDRRGAGISGGRHVRASALLRRLVHYPVRRLRKISWACRHSNALFVVPSEGGSQAPLRERCDRR